ncbi:MAG: sigma factor-like helix-turn-helix DNA-binding protein [Patescibacteria group bacterium]
MSKLTFKPAVVTKRLVQNLPDRSRDVILSRYGLASGRQAETLDAIGKRYGITRERVRQIENHAIKLIQESDAFVKEAGSFSALEDSIRDLGGILTEKTILNTLAPDLEMQNHLYFMLVVGDSFKQAKEDKDFGKRWFVDSDIAKAVESALKEVHQKVRPSDVLTEDALVTHVMGCLSRVNAKHRNRDTILRWLELSQCLVKNPLNEWGRTSAPGIKVKNIADYAYLVMKRNGSPMHFREVAKSIRELFGKKAHEATTHNELIKSDRFVLVGRGQYALKEWGYREGPVATIIENVLREHGALTRDQIIDKVLKERFVKTNTILVNLQNPKFSRLADGKYALKK